MFVQKCNDHVYVQISIYNISNLLIIRWKGKKIKTLASDTNIL